MKKIFKILLITLGIIVLLVASFFGYNMYQTYKSLNTPRFADNYYDNFVAGGELGK